MQIGECCFVSKFVIRWWLSTSDSCQTRRAFLRRHAAVEGPMSKPSLWTNFFSFPYTFSVVQKVNTFSQSLSGVEWVIHKIMLRQIVERWKEASLQREHLRWFSTVHSSPAQVPPDTAASQFEWANKTTMLPTIIVNLWMKRLASVSLNHSWQLF